LKKKDEPENAHINAVITITFLLYVNLFSVPIISLAAFEKRILNLPESNFEVKALIALILIVAGLFNFFLLARKKQHINIIDEFKMESEEKKEKGMLYTVLYLIISLGIPFCVFFFTTPPAASL
jgi:hypothetical protein